MTLLDFCFRKINLGGIGGGEWETEAREQVRDIAAGADGGGRDRLYPSPALAKTWEMLHFSPA